MKKKVIVIVIGGLVLLGGLSLGFLLGWLQDKYTDNPKNDTFVYDESVPVDLDQKTQVYDFILLDMSGSMDTIRQSVVDAFNSLLDELKAGNKRFSGTQEHYLTLRVFSKKGQGTGTRPTYHSGVFSNSPSSRYARHSSLANTEHVHPLKRLGHPL